MFSLANLLGYKSQASIWLVIKPFRQTCWPRISPNFTKWEHQLFVELTFLLTNSYFQEGTVHLMTSALQCSVIKKIHSNAKEEVTPRHAVSIQIAIMLSIVIKTKNSHTLLLAKRLRHLMLLVMRTVNASIRFTAGMQMLKNHLSTMIQTPNQSLYSRIIVNACPCTPKSPEKLLDGIVRTKLTLNSKTTWLMVSTVILVLRFRMMMIRNKWKLSVRKQLK